MTIDWTAVITALLVALGPIIIALRTHRAVNGLVAEREAQRLAAVAANELLMEAARVAAALLVESAREAKRLKE